MVDVIDVLSTLFMIIRYSDIQMPIPRSQLLSSLTGPSNRAAPVKHHDTCIATWQIVGGSYWPSEVALGGLTMTQRLNIKISARLSRCMLLFLL